MKAFLRSLEGTTSAYAEKSSRMNICLRMYRNYLRIRGEET